MCKYCSEDIKILNNQNIFYTNLVESSETEEQVYLMKKEDGRYFLVLCGVDVVSTDVYYCPKCGRKL